MTVLATSPIQIQLIGLVPDLIQSCIFFSPEQVDPVDPGNPDPEPPPDEPWIPTPPGYTPLPVVTIDTSPDEIIGCIIDTAANPQGRLNALFPDAVAGEGVLERRNNDIWVYGKTLFTTDPELWENVGPNPGLFVIDPVVIPPFDVTDNLSMGSRTGVRIAVFPYSLQELQEVAITVVSAVRNDPSQRSEVPQAFVSLQVYSPEILFVNSLIGIVAPSLYQGNGTTQTIRGLRYLPGIVWIKRRGVTAQSANTTSHVIFDYLRGATKYIQLTTNAQTTSLGSLTSFGEIGHEFSLGDFSFTNAPGVDFFTWVFARPSRLRVETSGTIASTILGDDNYNIIKYIGNGNAIASFGHGLGTQPAFILIKGLTISQPPVVATSQLSNNQYLLFNSSDGQATDSAVVNSLGSSVVNIGSSAYVNSIGREYIAYAFKQKDRLCKVGSYTGNSTGPGSTSGQYVDCGFKVDCLLIKRKSSGDWIFIDAARNTGINYLSQGAADEYDIGSLEYDIPYYSLGSAGFTVFNDNGRADYTTNLNWSTVNYIFIAFGSVRPTVVIPSAEIALLPQAPRVPKVVRVPSAQISLFAFTNKTIRVGQANLQVIANIPRIGTLRDEFDLNQLVGDSLLSLY